MVTKLRRSRANLHFSPLVASKCAFGSAELGFLGHRVSAVGMAMDPRKVAAVRNWPAPPSNVELRRFVWLCNYYRRFVDGYADIDTAVWPACALALGPRPTGEL